MSDVNHAYIKPLTDLAKQLFSELGASIAAHLDRPGCAREVTPAVGALGADDGPPSAQRWRSYVSPALVWVGKAVPTSTAWLDQLAVSWKCHVSGVWWTVWATLSAGGARSSRVSLLALPSQEGPSRSRGGSLRNLVLSIVRAGQVPITWMRAVNREPWFPRGL